ncbi:MAG: histidinol-phosphate transaminase [Ruminococcus sp.]|nr:histidinol-phosphate transaminase [Ruminococcus sp.]
MELNANVLKNIRRVEPYVPGEQPQNKVIKLNTNENPYPPAPGVLKALKDLEYDRFRLYPDPAAEELVDVLADYYHVKKDQVFVGVGSDDVLAMCFLTFFNSEKPILFPDITYSFYKVWAELYRIPYECPGLDEEFRIQKEDYYKENGGIIFPNPNAPTAVYENLKFVEDILEHNQDVIVIVDEAYIDFAGRSALELLDKHQNLIVVQTFSKARSMAGMRIGYAIGNPELIKYLNDAKYSFNSYTMNLPSLVCGTEAVKDKAYFDEITAKIVETREWSKKELKKLGFEFPEAKANFIFATHPEHDAEELFQALKKEGIYVRHWSSERIKQYLRITIGTREEMKILFDFLKEKLQSGLHS